MTNLSTQEQNLAQKCLIRSIQFAWQEYQLKSLQTTDEADNIARLYLALTLLETPDNRLNDYYIGRARTRVTLDPEQTQTSSWPLSRGTNIERLLHCAYFLLRSSSVVSHRASAQLIHEAATSMRYLDSAANQHTA